MSSIKAVSILGCGWLGTALGTHLYALGHQVKGSTTTESKFPALRNSIIDPYLVQLTVDNTAVDYSEFWDADALIIAISPGRQEEKLLNYRNLLQQVLPKIQNSPIQYVQFFSSVSVYGEPNAIVNEESPVLPETPSAIAIVQLEQELLSSNIPSAILRLGGLVGPGRDPGRFFAGKTDIPNGLAPVNMIEQAEAVRKITHILKEQLTGIFNVCSDEHPSREEYYTQAAEKSNLPVPKFIMEKESWKIVSSI